jgi:hypothetical protein
MILETLPWKENRTIIPTLKGLGHELDSKYFDING